MTAWFIKATGPVYYTGNGWTCDKNSGRDYGTKIDAQDALETLKEKRGDEEVAPVDLYEDV